VGGMTVVMTQVRKSPGATRSGSGATRRSRTSRPRPPGSGRPRRSTTSRRGGRGGTPARREMCPAGWVVSIGQASRVRRAAAAAAAAVPAVPAAPAAAIVTRQIACAMAAAALMRAPARTTMLGAFLSPASSLCCCTGPVRIRPLLSFQVTIMRARGGGRGGLVS
jgi:hypothetical protein